jgi:hypothetical protein
MSYSRPKLDTNLHPFLKELTLDEVIEIWTNWVDRTRGGWNQLQDDDKHTLWALMRRMNQTTGGLAVGSEGSKAVRWFQNLRRKFPPRAALADGALEAICDAPPPCSTALPRAAIPSSG